MSNFDKRRTVCGVAIIGAVFYGALGAVPGRGTFVHAMEVGMTIDGIALVLVAAITLLLPRRATR